MAGQSDLPSFHHFSEFTNDPDILYEAMLCSTIEAELLSTIAWSRNVPGFVYLPVQDQMSLTHASWCQLVCLNIALRSHPYEDAIVLTDDFHVHPANVPNVCQCVRCSS